MANVSSINQDNVFGNGKDEDLSPSEFDSSQEDAVVKKASVPWVLIFGIGSVIVVVLFFAWKIFSPYMNHSQGDYQNSISPVENSAPAVQFTDSPMPQSSAQMNQPQQPAASVNTVPGVSVPAVQAQQSAPVIAAQLSPVGGSVSASDKSLHPDAPVTAPVALVAPEDISKINKRIDDIAATLDALKDSVEKMKVVSKSTKPAVVVKKKPLPSTSVTTVSVATEKQSKSVMSEQSLDKSKDKSNEEYQMQAILKGIAWFKSKSGETFTVGPGEELKGVGIVDQIDPDANRVTFTNGKVFH